MTVDAATAAIDQAFFGFDQAEGLALLAGSFDPYGRKANVSNLLLPFLRLSDSYGKIPPASALSYLRLPGTMAAVVRRVNRGKSAGRNYSHALFGSAAALTPQMALSLADWSGWQEDRPANSQMPWLRPEDLSSALDDTARLRALSLRRPDLLTKVLAWELHTGGKPLSILGCPDEDRIGLLWGLLQLSGPARLSPVEWTFSTYEIEHGDHITYLPRLVFLPDKPDLTVPARKRRLVDLTQEQGSTLTAEQKAADLVQAYQQGIELRVAPEPQPEPELESGPELLESGPEPELEPASAAVSRTIGSPPISVSGGSPRRDFHHSPGPRDGVGPAQQVRHVRPPQPSELVARFLDAPDSPPGTVTRTWNELWIQALDPQERPAVRAGFAAAQWCGPRIVQTAPDDLVALSFGRGLPDLETADGRADAESLIKTTSSDELVRCLARMANQHGHLEPLMPALSRRWLQPPVPVPVPGPGGSGLIGHALAPFGVEVSPGRERLIVAGLILLAMIMSFFVGCAAANDPEPTEPPSVTPNTQPSGTHPSRTKETGPSDPVQSGAQPTPTPVSGNVSPSGQIEGSSAGNNVRVVLPVGNVPKNQPPWAFVSRGDTLYPQAQSCVLASGSQWQCPLLPPPDGWSGGDVVVVASVPDQLVSKLNPAGIKELPQGSKELFTAALP